MSKRLENKIALITGSAQGIGAAIAELFIKEGALVIVSDTKQKESQLFVQKLGNQAIFHPLDVAKENEWQEIFKFIEKRFGKLDILVNNAGITGFSQSAGAQDPEHASLESWHHVHAVNLDSVFLGCKHAIPYMKKLGGSIINIASRSGLVGVPRAAAYASSKAAVRNHTKSVALYCCEEGYPIRCNCISPAAILTAIWDPMFGPDSQTREKAIADISRDIPLKRMGDPLDVAYAALYLASEESKYMTGSEINLDGGILAGTAAAFKGKK